MVVCLLLVFLGLRGSRRARLRMLDGKADLAGVIGVVSGCHEARCYHAGVAYAGSRAGEPGRGSRAGRRWTINHGGGRSTREPGGPVPCSCPVFLDAVASPAMAMTYGRMVASSRTVGQARHGTIRPRRIPVQRVNDECVVNVQRANWTISSDTSGTGAGRTRLSTIDRVTLPVPPGCADNGARYESGLLAVSLQIAVDRHAATGGFRSGGVRPMKAAVVQLANRFPRSPSGR